MDQNITLPRRESRGSNRFSSFREIPARRHSLKHKPNWDPSRLYSVVLYGARKWKRVMFRSQDRSRIQSHIRHIPNADVRGWRTYRDSHSTCTHQSCALYTLGIAWAGLKFHAPGACRRRSVL